MMRKVTGYRTLKSFIREIRAKTSFSSSNAFTNQSIEYGMIAKELAGLRAAFKQGHLHTLNSLGNKSSNSSNNGNQGVGMFSGLWLDYRWQSIAKVVYCAMTLRNIGGDGTLNNTSNGALLTYYVCGEEEHDGDDSDGGAPSGLIDATAFAQVEAIKVAGGPRLRDKRLGYFAITQLLDHRQPAMTLLVNSLKQYGKVTIEKTQSSTIFFVSFVAA